MARNRVALEAAAIEESITREGASGPRVAVLGAFPYPYPQGSQIFVSDHSRALTRAGARPLLLTYGVGEGKAPADLELAASPRFLSPPRMKSGPSWQKLPGDAALCATYLSAHRRQRFDFAIAHNAEAALIALAARALIHVPVIYMVHTLLRFELSSYAPGSWARILDPLGREIDELVCRNADAIVTLSADAAELLAPSTRAPICTLPPGLDLAPEPDAEAQSRACARHALEPGGFALYMGNLDGYQDLELLAEAADRLARDPGPTPVIAVATHHRARARERFGRATNLRCIEVVDFDEMRALGFAAESLVLTRRRRGGFPIKLLNYMETRRPIVAFERIAPGFEDGKNAWLLAQGAGGVEIAKALSTLHRDPALAGRLGSGARTLLEARHAWPRLAAETLAFAQAVLARQ